jgi:hypothetical protein
MLKSKQLRIWKTSEKNNKTELQNKMEGQSSSREQEEDSNSELEDEMVIKGKNE